jgi:signal peptidase II
VNEAPPPSSAVPARTHWLVLLVTAGLVIVVDQTTKAIVRSRLPYGDTTRLGGILRLHHTRNDGLLGGLVHGAAVPVGIGTVIGIAIALAIYARHPQAAMRTRLAAGLLLGGAVGNLADRLRLGYVTDFIARGDRNAFNLADLAIYVGIGGLVLISVLAERRSPDRAPPA